MGTRRSIVVACLGIGSGILPAGVFGAEDVEMGTALPKPEVVLPPAPQAADLIPLYVAPNSVNAFFIDSKSLTVQPGGYIHYTVVIKSPAGASTVNFEGMKCPGWERRIHASGRSDGTWSRARGDAWGPVGGSGPNGYPYVLYRDHFCADGVPILDAEQGNASLRRSGEPMIDRMPGSN